MPKSFFEKVAADKTQLGFDYQDLVCLEYLIDLKPGESVGLEVFDDLHHERVSGTKALVQVKHSVSDGSALTNRDIDLWKTLHNWSNALDELSTVDIEFIFFTNKKKTSQSGVVQLLDNAKLDLTALVKVISNIKVDIDTKEKTKDDGATENPIKKHVDHIHALSEAKKTKLFGKISIIFSPENIFDRLTQKIEYFGISTDDALDVVRLLNGVFREQKYKLIKSDKKVEIDYETFRNDFQFNRIISISSDRKVDFSRYHHFKNVNDIDPKDGLFAKQLADIDIPQNEITEYAVEYAATNMFIQELIVGGRFSETENQSIDEEVYSAWKSRHKQLYNKSGIDSEADHKQVARDCLYKTEDASVQAANSSLSRPMVSGKSIELSDKCRIGWRKDWYDLYGNRK
tara:strand:- start:4422 stop:5624 length:1203 start_codon:yes stop_codon:yes gene_type:complete